MPDWKLQSLQVVWFVGQVPSQTVEAIYQTLFGSVPQSIQKNQIPGMPNDATTETASGQIGNISYQLQIAPGRVDLIVTAAAVVPQNKPPLFDDARILLHDIYNRIIRVDLTSSRVERVAIIGNFWDLADSPDAANRSVFNRLGFDGSWEGASDLSFQVAKRKAIAAQGGRSINRLLLWNTVNVQLLQFQRNNFANLHAATTIPQVIQTYAAALSVDVNSVPNPGEVYPLAVQASIFAECRQELLRLWQANSPQALL